MTLDLCDKIVNNMKLKAGSICNDIRALNEVVLKIEDSFIKNSRKMDPIKQNEIYHALNNIGDGINDSEIFLADFEPEIELLLNNINIIRDNIAEENDV